jgi:hypothetical protein
MKQLFIRDIPPRAAAVVIALVLAASVGMGREEQSSGATPVNSQGSSVIREAPTTTPTESALPDLDLDKLNRVRKEEKIANLFAPKVPIAPPPPAAAALMMPAPPPPPVPTAPALPFQYLGRLIDGDKNVVFLLKKDEALSVSAGDILGDGYKVESITETAVNFIYTPLGTKQSLPIPSPNN